MRYVFAIGLCLAWLAAGCSPPREPAAPENPPTAEPGPAAPERPTASRWPQFSNQAAATTAPAELGPAAPPLRPGATNLPARETNLVLVKQTVPDELLAQIVARFPFDRDENSDPAGGGAAIAGNFQRAGAGYADSQPVATNQPRLVKGKFGRGLLLEESHRNWLSRNQAAVEGTTRSSFLALNGATLGFCTNEHWQGNQALEIMTPGAGGEEGFAIEVLVERAFYDGRQIVPAHYIASVYLKGSGELLLALKDTAPAAETEPATVKLDQTAWQRYACNYQADFPTRAIGPGHETDWKKFLPADARLETKLRLICTTLDRKKTTYYADGCQVEQRRIPFAAQGPGASPRSWTAGGSTAGQDEFALATQGAAFQAWKQTGAISFWFKPSWDIRDGTQELLLDLASAAIQLQHLRGKLSLQPAGGEYLLHDWQDNWHHLAVTWDAEGRRVLYVDGYDYGSKHGETQPMPEAAERLALSLAGNGKSPNGVIDELILFQGPLNLEQIKAIAAYTPPPMLNPTNNPPEHVEK